MKEWAAKEETTPLGRSPGPSGLWSNEQLSPNSRQGFATSGSSPHPGIHRVNPQTAPGLTVMFTTNRRWGYAIPQSFNRYAYVQNDPVNFVDPSGLNMAAPNCYMVLEAGDGGFQFGIFYERWVCTTENIDTGRRGPPDLNPDGGGNTVPDPPNTNLPNTADDPCDSDRYPSELKSDLSQIAKTIGGSLDSNWNIHGPRRLTVDTAVGRLENAGFAQFHSYNPDHPGINLQGQLNGRWYHVTVSPFSTPNAAVNANQSASGPNVARNSPSNHSPSRINKITAHCEKNKPDSAAHFWDYLKGFFW